MLGLRNSCEGAAMKSRTRIMFSVVDIMLVPFVYPAAWLLKRVRAAGVHLLPRSKDALLDVGVFPILNHYYEPQFDNRVSTSDLSQDRNLQGIDWNVPGQLEMLESDFDNFISQLSNNIEDFLEANPALHPKNSPQLRGAQVISNILAN